MQLADGTILEGVDADEILVTDASLVEGHGGHSAKRDDDEKKDKEEMEEAHCPSGKRDEEDEDLKEAEELEEGELPAGLKAYQDKKKGSEKKDDKDEDLEEGSKPDYIDIDKDGDKEESMKDAAKDAKKKTMNEAFFHPRHQELFENLKNKWCK